MSASGETVVRPGAGDLSKGVRQLEPEVLLRFLLLIGPTSGRATDARDRHVENRHQRVKVPSSYPQGYPKGILKDTSSYPQVIKYTKGMS